MNIEIGRATDAPPGSPEKLEILRRRIESGQPLWHPDDRTSFEGLIGAVEPRDDERRDRNPQ